MHTKLFLKYNTLLHVIASIYPATLLSPSVDVVMNACAKTLIRDMVTLRISEIVSLIRTLYAEIYF